MQSSHTQALNEHASVAWRGLQLVMLLLLIHTGRWHYPPLAATYMCIMADIEWFGRNRGQFKAISFVLNYRIIHHVNRQVLHMCINTFICFVIVLIHRGKGGYFQNWSTYWSCKEDGRSTRSHINDMCGKGHHHQTVYYVNRVADWQVDILMTCVAKATTKNGVLCKDGDRLTGLMLNCWAKYDINSVYIK